MIAQGFVVSRKREARLMRQQGIRGFRPPPCPRQKATHIPVEQLAELDADVGDDVGDVGRLVLMAAPESFSMIAFWSPMMKHSSITVIGTKSLRTSANRAPKTPKHSRSASSTSGNADSLFNWRCLAMFTMMAEHAVPARRDSKAPTGRPGEPALRP